MGMQCEHREVREKKGTRGRESIKVQAQCSSVCDGCCAGCAGLRDGQFIQQQQASVSK